MVAQPVARTVLLLGVEQVLRGAADGGVVGGSAGEAQDVKALTGHQHMAGLALDHRPTAVGVLAIQHLREPLRNLLGVAELAFQHQAQGEPVGAGSGLAVFEPRQGQRAALGRRFDRLFGQRRDLLERVETQDDPHGVDFVGLARGAGALDLIAFLPPPLGLLHARDDLAEERVGCQVLGVGSGGAATHDQLLHGREEPARLGLGLGVLLREAPVQGPLGEVRHPLAVECDAACGRLGVAPEGEGDLVAGDADASGLAAAGGAFSPLLTAFQQKGKAALDGRANEHVLRSEQERFCVRGGEHRNGGGRAERRHQDECRERCM